MSRPSSEIPLDAKQAFGDLCKRFNLNSDVTSQVLSITADQEASLPETREAEKTADLGPVGSSAPPPAELIVEPAAQGTDQEKQTTGEEDPPAAAEGSPVSTEATTNYQSASSHEAADADKGPESPSAGQSAQVGSEPVLINPLLTGAQPANPEVPSAAAQFAAAAAATPEEYKSPDLDFGPENCEDLYALAALEESLLPACPSSPLSLSLQDLQSPLPFSLDTEKLQVQKATNQVLKARIQEQEAEYQATIKSYVEEAVVKDAELFRLERINKKLGRLLQEKIDIASELKAANESLQCSLGDILEVHEKEIEERQAETVKLQEDLRHTKKRLRDSDERVLARKKDLYKVLEGARVFQRLCSETEHPWKQPEDNTQASGRRDRSREKIWHRKA